MELLTWQRNGLSEDQPSRLKFRSGQNSKHRMLARFAKPREKASDERLYEIQHSYSGADECVRESRELTSTVKIENGTADLCYEVELVAPLELSVSVEELDLPETTNETPMVIETLDSSGDNITIVVTIDCNKESPKQKKRRAIQSLRLNDSFVLLVYHSLKLSGVVV
ncbi:hypothetical protein Rs2_26358 [Raphanus sativus]|nr:hypothetical protein Rs2_26358 [Raphanus sativus]